MLKTLLCLKPLLGVIVVVDGQVWFKFLDKLQHESHDDIRVGQNDLELFLRTLLISSPKTQPPHHNDTSNPPCIIYHDISWFNHNNNKQKKKKTPGFSFLFLLIF